MRCPPPGDLPNSGIEPMSPAFADGFFTTSATWKALTLVPVLTKGTKFQLPGQLVMGLVHWDDPEGWDRE